VLQKDEEDSWTDHVRTEEVLQGIKMESNIHEIKRRKAN
jgi:hypothetical protein